MVTPVPSENVSKEVNRSALSDGEACLLPTTSVLAPLSKAEWMDWFFPYKEAGGVATEKIDRLRKDFDRSTVHGKAVTDPNGPFARAERHGALRIVAEGMGGRLHRGRLVRLLDGVGYILDACPPAIKQLIDLEVGGPVERRLPGKAHRVVVVERESLRQVVLDVVHGLISGGDPRDVEVVLLQFWDQANHKAVRVRRGRQRSRLLAACLLGAGCVGALFLWEEVTGDISHYFATQKTRVLQRWQGQEAFFASWSEVEPLAKALVLGRYRVALEDLDPGLPEPNREVILMGFEEGYRMDQVGEGNGTALQVLRTGNDLTVSEEEGGVVYSPVAHYNSYLGKTISPRMRIWLTLYYPTVPKQLGAIPTQPRWKILRRPVADTEARRLKVAVEASFATFHRGIILPAADQHRAVAEMVGLERRGLGNYEVIGGGLAHRLDTAPSPWGDVSVDALEEAIESLRVELGFYPWFDGIVAQGIPERGAPPDPNDLAYKLGGFEGDRKKYEALLAEYTAQRKHYLVQLHAAALVQMKLNTWAVPEAAVREPHEEAREAFEKWQNRVLDLFQGVTRKELAGLLRRGAEAQFALPGTRGIQVGQRGGVRGAYQAQIKEVALFGLVGELNNEVEALTGDTGGQLIQLLAYKPGWNSDIKVRETYHRPLADPQSNLRAIALLYEAGIYAGERSVGWGTLDGHEGNVIFCDQGTFLPTEEGLQRLSAAK